MNKDDKVVSIQMQTIRQQKRFEDEKDERKRNDNKRLVEEMKKSEKKKIRDDISSTSSQLVQKKIKIVNFIITLLIVLNIAIALFENSIFIDPRYAKDNSGNIIMENDSPKLAKAEYEADNLVIMMKWANVGICVLIELLLIYRYNLEVKLLQNTHYACRSDNIFTTGLWKYFMIEFFILAIVSPPHTTKILKGQMLFGKFTYASDSIILVFVFLKLYYLSYIYQNFSLWTTIPIQKVGRQFNVTIGFGFAFKAQIRQYPLMTISGMLMFALCILAIMLRVFEYGYSDDEPQPGSKGIINTKFKSYQDNFWLVIISMLTIGYGDLNPSTHFGRMIIFLGSIIGMLIVSLLIVTLSYMVEFTLEEQKAYEIITNKISNSQKKVNSANLIVEIMKLLRTKKTGEINNKYKSK